jgi:lysophospholipase L1-like esterase
MSSLNISRLVPAALIAGLAFSTLVTARAQDDSSGQAKEYKFTFDRTAPGYTEVKPDTLYSDSQHYGFLTPAVGGTGASIFAVDMPEGNYDVTVTFGKSKAAASTTIKAEQRRLMVEKVDTAPGQLKTVTFTINVRTPKFAGGEVAIDGREVGPPVVPDWDNKLSFEINGANPGVTAIDIKPNPDALTVYICGDSTVTDQTAEPWCSWGQMVTNFFDQGTAVANYAQSGLTLSSFEHQKRLAKILAVIKKGDYVLIQFGHNDQKDKAPGSGPYTSYEANLKRYIDEIKAKGGLPIVVTPMERRRVQGTTFLPTLADFAAGAIQAAGKESVPVIDLNAMSLKVYTALGPDGSTKAFCQVPANTFPGQAVAIKDNTHFQNYGAYELARCIVEGIKANVPALAVKLRKDIPAFDPSKPDPVAAFDVPWSPTSAPNEKPAGS